MVLRSTLARTVTCKELQVYEEGMPLQCAGLNTLGNLTYKYVLWNMYGMQNRSNSKQNIMLENRKHVLTMALIGLTPNASCFHLKKDLQAKGSRHWLGRCKYLEKEQKLISSSPSSRSRAAPPQADQLEELPFKLIKGSSFKLISFSLVPSFQTS